MKLSNTTSYEIFKNSKETIFNTNSLKYEQSQCRLHRKSVNPVIFLFTNPDK
jgi:hypothetical protein